MKISVLIPTYNRREWLLRTLANVAVQSFSDFEVIVIDASSPEDQLTDADVARFSFAFSYQRYGIAGNVSRQRNIALNLSKGELVLFLDDDVDFEPGLFEKYEELFRQSKYQAISGLVETPSVKRGHAPVVFTNPFNDTGAPNYQPCDFEIETYIICTANFAFRRAVYIQYGGFDEKIFGVLDDVDYGLKLQRDGVVVYHHPAVAVFHHQVKGSGSRSSSIPTWWTYYNIAYFQLKNFNHKPFIFFIKCSWQLLRPSSVLLTLTTYFGRYRDFVTGFRKAYAAVIESGKNRLRK